MFDVILRGGTLVDGSGRPGRRADVGISGGRIAALGELPGAAARRAIDADGRVVCPGFIDIHTHYDAQLLWDPTLSPSPLHGVTTVFSGNCGLSLAPLEPKDQDFMLRLLSRVEAIPLESLERGVEVRWRSFAEYLDCMERAPLAINAGFLAGHAPIRRAVMGESASEKRATPDEVRRMQALLHEALAAGAAGFSGSASATQLDGDGRRTPSSFASAEELIALARVCRDHPGTSLEYIPESSAWGFEKPDLELLVGMAAAAERALNWNTILLDYPAIPDIHERQLASFDVAARRGARVVPMLIPHNFRVRTDFLESDVGFRSIPGFERLFELDVDARVAALADPAVRAQLARSLAGLGAGTNAMFRDALAANLVSDSDHPALQALLGRRVADVAAERGTSVLDTMFDLAVESRLDVGFVRYLVKTDTPERRALRARVLRDPRVVLGASDGGAHLRGVINAEYSSASFAELVRDEPVFSLEELVRQFTDVPAQLYGLKDRGRIAEGSWADVVIFDPAAIGASPVKLVRDLPGGAARLLSRGLGIDAVLVAGQEIVRDGSYTGAMPGRLLRAGRDTGRASANG
jgi:N-acyl-D-aspartate/D-glutamate deacylase